jgi:hypothetical protein
MEDIHCMCRDCRYVTAISTAALKEAFGRLKREELKSGESELG